MHLVKMAQRNIYFETYGCAMNQSDTQYLIQAFLDHNFSKADFESSEYVLINTCGVKKTTEDRVISRLERLSRSKKKIIIVGCLPKINLDRILDACPNYHAIFDTNLNLIRSRIPKIINSGSKILELSEKKSEKISVKPFYENPYRSIISISEGCVGRCSFCCTKHARGHIKSYPKEKIVERVKKDIEYGIKEIFLTSQDLSAYGYDLDYNLVDLLNEILSIDSNFRIRLGMMNPNTLEPILDGLLGLYKDKRIYDFLHLPLQSGSDRILKLMGRKYTSDKYLELIDKIKSKINNLNLWTDIIVGFPEETDEDFRSTIDVIKKIRPQKINISKYGVRPNTKAKRMKQVDSKIIKERSRSLTNIYYDISRDINKKYIGKEVEALFTEYRGQYLGRSNNFHRVISDNAKLGEFSKIKINKIGSGCLFGD